MADTNSNTNVNVDANQQPEAKTYTEEEVAKLLQSEADRRVNQALAKQKKEYEKQMSLSSLDADSREKAEKDIRI